MTPAQLSWMYLEQKRTQTKHKPAKAKLAVSLWQRLLAHSGKAEKQT